jgi:thiol-disulfide isomerase/thioredoxin
MKNLPLLIAATLCANALGADDFAARNTAAQAALKVKRAQGREAFVAELEVQGRGLVRDFPEQEEGYKMLMAIANSAPPERQEAILKELDKEKIPASVKEAISGMRRKAAMVGKPLDLQFTAIDGRRVDLSAMKGKVVLVDFWATWCGPCVAEIPHVKKAYEKLHARGFEIVGISFDSDKAKLEAFVKEKAMPWPQFFDGEGWKNRFAQQYGIRSIPAMWLVNKAGNLVDMNARTDLDGKVEKLLAE